MILLTGHTLTPKEVFFPESQPLNLVDRGVSTSSITVGPEAPVLTLGDWIKDDTEPGKGIIWRVKSVETAYERDTRTVQLEHVIATLKDTLIFGTLGGSNASAESMARQALARQSIWTLGAFEFSRTLPYQFNNQTVYAALETICGTLDGWRWEYDLTSMPFTLNIVKKSTDVASELRASRNLVSIRRTVDLSGMYTRFYPVGARNMHITGNYVSRNEDLYGVISHTETDQSINSKDMLRAWAEDKLSRHAEPQVNITATALELSRATGEPLDKLTLGRVCRVPLPEFGTTIRETITRLSWSDKIKQPETVTVTLANELVDVASILKQTSGSGSRNAGGSAMAQEEDHAWIEDTVDHVLIVAEAVAGTDEQGEVDWSRVASIMVDGSGIYQRVVKTEGDMVTAQTAIETNENGITSLVQKTGVDGLAPGQTLYTRISQNADSISSVAGRTSDLEGDVSDIQGSALWQNRNSITGVVGNFTVSGNTVKLNSGSSLQILDNGVYSTVGTVSYTDRVIGPLATSISTIEGSGIWQSRDNITSIVGKFTTDGTNVKLVSGAGLYVDRNGVSIEVVDKGNVLSSINASSESVDISASKINLTGYVTASQLSAANARIDNLLSGTTTMTLCNARDIRMGGYSFYRRTITVDGTTYNVIGWGAGD